MPKHSSSTKVVSRQRQRQAQQYGSTLLIARRGKANSILLVALHRPKVKNAFSDEQYLDLISILKRVQDDDSIHALVLTGMGDYFSSGADLSAFNFEEDVEDEEDNSEDNSENLNQRKGTIDKPAGRFMMAMLSFPKVLCCAVNGPAVGIGVTLLPHCDLVYCTKDSTFWVPFTRIALVPEFASSITFVEAMGMGCANEMLLLGEKIDAQKAVSYRLCNGIIHDCNHRCEDAFASDSIGMMVCDTIDRKLLSLPSGDRTAKIFVNTIRGKRKEYLAARVKEELVLLDMRIESGEVLEAVMELSIAKSKL